MSIVYVIVGRRNVDDKDPCEMDIDPSHFRGGTHISQRARRVRLGAGKEWKTAKGAQRVLDYLPNESETPELRKWNGYYWRVEVRNARRPLQEQRQDQGQ